MKIPKIKVPRIRVYSFMLLALLALLALSAYTTILQGMYNDSILENTVQENIRRTDAMHEGIDILLTRAAFPRSTRVRIWIPSVILRCSST